LPLVERCFAIVTDVSLLELGDGSRPLLQELVRRAPGTYTHSMTVATLAEPAAESIGANALLARVGSYFHDIGKMLKPQYFIENQTGENRHDALEPALSTLIIIGHVKDGVALASASRALALPTPSSLRKLVHDILMKRLLDGQFEESGLTLTELHVVEESLCKGLIALYHSRIKYPEPERKAG